MSFAPADAPHQPISEETSIGQVWKQLSDCYWFPKDKSELELSPATFTLLNVHFMHKASEKDRFRPLHCTGALSVEGCDRFCLVSGCHGMKGRVQTQDTTGCQIINCKVPALLVHLFNYFNTFFAKLTYPQNKEYCHLGKFLIMNANVTQNLDRFDHMACGSQKLCKWLEVAKHLLPLVQQTLSGAHAVR